MTTILIFFSTSHIRTLDWKACTHFHWTDRVLITPGDLAIRHSDNPAAFVSNKTPGLSLDRGKRRQRKLQSISFPGSTNDLWWEKVGHLLKGDVEEHRKHDFHDTGVPTEDRGSDACHEVLTKHQLLIRKSEC